MNTPGQLLKTKSNGKTSLRPHQVKAVKAVISEFLSQPRTKYIAACGTGKTMVGLHVAEALNPRSVIVFLPSLALIRQTLIEWSREKMFNGNYANLFVCSDQTITDDLDSIVMTEEEFGHPITTDSLAVRRFLLTPSSGVKLIFSTYNSAGALAEGTPAGFKFDFAVMDEAHRTAGPAGKPFGIVLDDTKLPIKKRLFLTATPRLYKVKKALLDSEVLSYSMDSPKLYGTTAERLPFKDAVEMNLITPYEILASVITSADVDRELLEKELLFNNKLFDVKRIANLVSIRDAVRQHDIKKIFTFHGRIEEAKEFVEAKNPAIQDYLPDFKILHISGEMPMEKRNRIMEEFRLAERALISNAKVLSEGIDVPSVDMVTFMCPKKSTVDIVQAVGRVSRNHPGKKSGYVLLPLFLDQQRKETEDEAFDRTEFAFMWNVLKSMKSEDDTLDLIIKNESMKMGEAGDGYIPDFKDKIRILGSPDTLEAISRSIKTMIIETVGYNWDYWLGLLLSYKKEYGHCDVPERHVYKGKRLGGWVRYLRELNQKNKLGREKEALLKILGVKLMVHEETFSNWISLLKEYKKEFGHCEIPNHCIFKERKLWIFVRTQRELFQNGTLKPERKTILENLGVRLNSLEESYAYWIPLLEEYKKQFGDCDVPKGYIFKGKHLGSFLARQRRLKINGKLDPKYEAILETLGVIWTPLEDHFLSWILLLKEYKRELGNCDCPHNSVYRGKKLGIFLTNQRRYKAAGTLLPEREAILKKLGVRLTPGPDSFYSWIPLLKDYKREFGHCDFTQICIYKGKQIRSFIAQQRQLKRAGKLIPEKERILKSFGIRLNKEEDRFFTVWIPLLKLYIKEFGHCDVPIHCVYHEKRLGSFVSNQRHFKKNNLLDSEKIRMLAKLGMAWEPKKSKFTIWLPLLEEYKKQFGDCNVPKGFIFKGKHLGSFVSNQRKRKKEGTLNPEREKILSKLGLKFAPRTEGSSVWISLLKEYKKEFGHCDVPCNYVYKKKKLGQWVSVQRRSK